MASARAVADPATDTSHGEQTSATGQRDRVWAAATLLVVFVASVVPLTIDRWYYYMADTSEGAYGLWYHLGQEISAGRWPLLNPSAWMSGNYAAEGQWGLFSPITIAIGLACIHFSNVLIFSAIVKIVFLLVAAGGIYAVARDYGIRPQWAFVAGTAAPMSGFTMYMDAPSWVTNLIVWALLPWAWLGVRRYVRGRSPWLALLGCYLVVSIGYVHGVVMLFTTLGGLLLETFITRRARVLAVVWVGAFSFLVTLTVFLPGFLSVGATNRKASGIGNDGFMVADLTGLVSSVIPSSLPQVSGWWGMFAAGPVLYTAWLLPTAFFVTGIDIRRMIRDFTTPLVLLIVAAAFVLGPSYLGPLRFPTRLMPFLVTAVLLLWAYLMSNRSTAPIPVSRMWMAQGFILVATYLSASQVPSTWLNQALFGILVSVMTWLVWSLLNRGIQELGKAAAVMGATSLVFLGIQHLMYEGTQTSSGRRFPAQVEDYRSQLAAGKGDAIVVGAVPQTPPDVVPVSLVANQWYLNSNVRAQNLYTTIQFKGFNELMCMDHRGSTCPELLTRLFQQPAGLQITLVDALAVDTIQVLKTDIPAPTPRPWPPKGWSIASDGPDDTVLVRDQPTGGAGGPVALQGARVTVLDTSNDAVRLRVESVDPDGGVITFSRLAWPGYTVTGGGSTGEPAGGFLQTVRVAPTDAGEEMVLQFRPPGWTVGIAALGLAGVLAALLLIAGAVGSRLTRGESAET